MKKHTYFLISCLVILFSITTSYTQDKEAKITLTFKKIDSVNVCKAFVTSEGQPVIEVPVNLSVKRLFAKLPIGDAIATDSTGVATFEFPNDIPSKNGKLTLFASIVDDENYTNSETSGEVNWGTVVVTDNSNIDERSFSAGRDRAPIYFITISLLILGLIWGTLLFAVLQVFKIKKLGKIQEIKE
ncbi:hypothetical protein FNW25_05825 [Flavobacterium franklandianum]|uniref:hypothetical protein n=1 Tax=Flavobacterium franklandianum TaxID=2594430 RepID=UPI00117A613B|nr:hypothetical protein [Flavobacterium franklandianum]TRX27778.1 hypothetical protein FNW25_05825 [Flavobacterium franklandianum]